MDVEAIDKIEDAKDSETNKYEIVMQYMQDAQSNQVDVPPQNPFCQKVSDLADNNRTFSMECATEPMLDKIIPMGVADQTSGASVLVSDQQNQREAGLDIGLRQDEDGDGIPDALDSKNETRAQIAARKMDKMMEAIKKKKSPLFGGQLMASIKNTTKILDAINSGLFGDDKKKNKGPGNLDLGDKDKDEDKGIGGLFFSMDSSG